MFAGLAEGFPALPEDHGQHGQAGSAGGGPTRPAVTNTGKVAHEFVTGDQAFQDEHDKEMAGQTMPMHDDADGIGLPAGATKTLTDMFKQAGPLQYACHTAGHYQAGMKGTITVS